MTPLLSFALVFALACHAVAMLLILLRLLRGPGEQCAPDGAVRTGHGHSLHHGAGSNSW